MIKNMQSLPLLASSLLGSGLLLLTEDGCGTCVFFLGWDGLLSGTWCFGWLGLIFMGAAWVSFFLAIWDPWWDSEKWIASYDIKNVRWPLKLKSHVLVAMRDWEWWHLLTIKRFSTKVSALLSFARAKDDLLVCSDGTWTFFDLATGLVVCLTLCRCFFLRATATFAACSFSFFSRYTSRGNGSRYGHLTWYLASQ